jgi:hypothetical protein
MMSLKHCARIVGNDGITKHYVVKYAIGDGFALKLQLQLGCSGSKLLDGVRSDLPALKDSRLVSPCCARTSPWSL